MRTEPAPRFGARPDLFDQFVTYRRALGYLYGATTVDLAARLSRHMDAFPPAPGILTEEMVLAFCEPAPGRKALTRKRRWSMARQFALFLQASGHDAWVPGDFPEKCESGFAPRILSPDEMARVIAQADQPPGPRQTEAARRVCSMLVRMLWCCGLRINEALNLTVGDVDLGNGVLTVTKAKHGRTRLVPMSKSLADHARGYADQAGLPCGPADAWFYPSPRGGPYHSGSARSAIQKIMLRAGVTTDGSRPPRVHDLRHSYAVACLVELQNNGSDVRAALPALAAYMGHADITSTEYYLKLAAYAHPDVEAAMAGAYQGVFPEVG
ncbi:MAG: tyrosine-type recombinase/integrase [Bifidobacteriaceae bacterium]|jgi:integrase|nr:tyrosine-type recombinase/integrase [Bifidobacteriaceae bacterium]